MLGRAPYWEEQKKWCDALIKYHDIAIPSGNSVGKSYWLGGIVPWWLFTRPNSLAVTTAPSATQLGTVLWKEIRRAHANARIDLGGWISASSLAAPQRLDLGNGWAALGIATTSVERLSGQHAKQLLVCVDEASGVDLKIWEALDSMVATKFIAIGNPLRAEGRFYDLCKQAEREEKDGIPDARRVFRIHCPSTMSPDAEHEVSTRGLASKSWLEAMARRYGKNSLWWKTHIKAEFPEQSFDTLIPAEWLDLATTAAMLEQASKIRSNAKILDPGGKRRLACDLGEGVGRDRTVIVIRDDVGILHVEGDSSLAIPECAFRMRQLASQFGVEESHVTYDGAGIGRELRKYLDSHGLKHARSYHGAASGGIEGRFSNLRTASAWRLRRRLDPENPERSWPFHFPIGPNWETMREELLALRYDLQGEKTRLERKDDMKARLGRSPDFADAIMQTFSYE